MIRVMLLRNIQPIEVYSRFTLGLINGEEIIAIAKTWLEAYPDSENLNELSWQIQYIMSDISPLFIGFMAELEISKPNIQQAAILVTHETIKRIVELEVDPIEATEFLYWKVHHQMDEKFQDSEYIGDNLGLENIFCWLREYWDSQDGSMVLYYPDIPRNIAEKKYVAHIIEEAGKHLAQAT